MARTDGKKIVGLAFAGITGVIGIAQVYLPYIADRDKLRGLFEEEDMPSQAKHEMDMMMRAEKAAMEAAAGEHRAEHQRPEWREATHTRRTSHVLHKHRDSLGRC